MTLFIGAPLNMKRIRMVQPADAGSGTYIGVADEFADQLTRYKFGELDVAADCDWVLPAVGDVQLYVGQDIPVLHMTYAELFNLWRDVAIKLHELGDLIEEEPKLFEIDTRNVIV